MIEKINSEDLDEADRVAGFELKEVPNPEKYAGSPEKISVVIRMLGPSDRVIKVVGPLGTVYKHQRYGYIAGDKFKKEDWFPVGGGVYPTPNDSLRADCNTPEPTIIPAIPTV